MTTARTRLLALLGHPVSHSRSPEMMSAALAHAGIDAVYLACEVPPESLDDAVRGLFALGAVGANVTVPHKRAVLAVCNAVDPAARAVGAANVLVRDGAHWIARNTDAPGAVAALADAGVSVRGVRVTVLGAGGAARAVAVGVALAGAREVTVLARREESAREVARVAHEANVATAARGVNLDDPRAVTLASATDVIVQCTPVGMASHAIAESPRFHTLLEKLPAHAAAMDLVYTPCETPFLTAARARGLCTVDGLGMLAHQGALALEAWFGVTVAGSELRRFLDGAESRAVQT